MRTFTILDWTNSSETIAVRRDDQYIPSEVHAHDFFELEYIIAGNGIHAVNGKEYKVQRGDVIILEAGSIHSYYSVNHMEVVNCILSLEIYENEKAEIIKELQIESMPLPDFIRLSGRQYMELEEFLLKLEQEYLLKRPGCQLFMKSYLRIFLSTLFRNITEQKNLNVESSLQRKILTYLDSNYTHTSLSEMASFFGYTPSYFSKYLKKIMGCTLTDYVNRRRMDEAVKLISTTSYSIENIIHTLGVTDKKCFYKQFKLRTGVTPNEYRKSMNRPAQ